MRFKVLPQPRFLRPRERIYFLGTNVWGGQGLKEVLNSRTFVGRSKNTSRKTAAVLHSSRFSSIVLKYSEINISFGTQHLPQEQDRISKFSLKLIRLWEATLSPPFFPKIAHFIRLMFSTWTLSSFLLHQYSKSSYASLPRNLLMNQSNHCIPKIYLQFATEY